MPAWLALVIEYCITKWKDLYASAKRFLKWITYDLVQHAIKMKNKAKKAEDKLDNREVPDETRKKH